MALAVTAIAKFIVMDWLGMRAFFIIATGFFWLWYGRYRYLHEKSILEYWGFKRDNFLDSWKVLLPFFLVSTFLAALYALNNGISVDNPHLIPILILYPIWGLTQQFIFLCIITLNLQQLKFFSGNTRIIYLAVPVLFSMIHYPDPYLMGITFIMEIVFMITFMKWRNIWAIGLAHGGIAAFVLFYIFNRDLWKELFAWF
ncbi:MAG TPA: CPBP family glutamic-type intramembrane protease [Bacteroidales bacterium]|nr:CPBP family glutamic-type intramembrane protease [Bacteroidales bacterium]